MLRVKEQYLDIKVTDPFTGMDVIMRFVDERLYIHYIKYYPELFESVIIEKPIKKDIFK